jgi:hypothetical protein
MNTNETSTPESPQPMAQPRIVVKAVPPHQTRPAPREVQDRARLATEVKGSLDVVRKTAENWRTGMAGLVTLVTATLLFKGRDSINDYANWIRYVLGALVLVSLVLAVASLWLFLTAAYGRLKPTSAQAILDAGGVDIHNVHLTTAALGDLNVARRLGLASAGLLAAALLLSWYGPAASAEPDTHVKVVVASETSPETETPLCGELKALDRDVTVLQVAGEPEARRVKTERLVSLNIVASC